MKAVRHLLALVALALAATTASAQFVKGNEAVKVMPDGTKKIETAATSGIRSRSVPMQCRQTGMLAAAGRWSRHPRARRVHGGLRAGPGIHLWRWKRLACGS